MPWRKDHRAGDALRALDTLWVLNKKFDVLLHVLKGLLSTQEAQMASLNDLRQAQGAVAVAIGAVFTEVQETADRLAGLRSVIDSLQDQLDDAQLNQVDQDAVDAALSAVDRLGELAAALNDIQQDPNNPIPVDEPIEELPAPPPGIPGGQEPAPAPAPEPGAVEPEGQIVVPEGFDPTQPLANPNPQPETNG